MHRPSASYPPALATLLGLLLFTVVCAAAPQPRINPGQISVSGLSSGAYMAVQLHVAYSDRFMGVGAVAGGPFFCAEHYDSAAISEVQARCLSASQADHSARTYIEAARRAAAAGHIAALAHLSQDRVFLFNSHSDQVVNPSLGKISQRFYQQFVDHREQIQAWSFLPRFGPLYPVAHGMPTAKQRFRDFSHAGDLLTPCAPSRSGRQPWLRGSDPWLYYCNLGLLDGYDLVQDMLSHIYGALARAKPAQADHMYAFDQLPYLADPAITSNTALAAHGLGRQAYLYIPAACHQGQSACRLHVALHGCHQFPEWSFQGKAGSRVGNQTVRFGGLFRDNLYNHVAEANNIVVLYPQAHNIGSQPDDINPYGCWEFWPFFAKDRHNYYSREGRTLKMIDNMIDALLQQQLSVTPLARPEP